MANRISKIVRQHDWLELVTITFLGGATNAVFLKDITLHFLYGWGEINIIGQFMYVVFILLLPFLISFIARLGSRSRASGLRFVPALPLQFVSLALLTGYEFILILPVNFPVFFLLFYYAFLGGFVQDRITIELFGRYGDREQIITSSLEVNADIETIKQLLRSNRVRNHLSLSRWRGVRKTARGYRLRTARAITLQAWIELERGSVPHQTFINLAFYKLKAYSFHRTEESEEDARATTAYLRQLFEDNQMRVENAPLFHNEPLVDVILDGMQGTNIFRELTTPSWFALFATGTSIVATGFLFVSGASSDVILGAIGVTALIAFETIQLIRQS